MRSGAAPRGRPNTLAPGKEDGSHKDGGRIWMEGHGWPTARQSYLSTWVKEGVAPPTTRQNVVEWMKVPPPVTMPIGTTGQINPAATRLLNEAIEGKRTVRDAADAMAREITNLLERG